MIEKEFRIKDRRQFHNVYNNGRKFISKCLIIFIIENNSGFNRYGIVTSKRIGNAVRRNKAKRRLRALIYENRNDFKPGFDIVVVSRPLISKVNYEQLKRDFMFIMRKTGIC